MPPRGRAPVVPSTHPARSRGGSAPGCISWAWWFLSSSSSSPRRGLAAAAGSPLLSLYRRCPHPTHPTLLTLYPSPGTASSWRGDTAAPQTPPGLLGLIARAGALRCSRGPGAGLVGGGAEVGPGRLIAPQPQLKALGSSSLARELRGLCSGGAHTGPRDVPRQPARVDAIRYQRCRRLPPPGAATAPGLCLSSPGTKARAARAAPADKPRLNVRPLRAGAAGGQRVGRA